MLQLLAQLPDPNTPDLSINTSNTLYRIADLGVLISRVLQVAIGITGLIILLYLVWGGIDWIFSGEDKGKVEAAKSKLTQGIVGLAVFVSVFAIYFILVRFLGIGNRINIFGFGSGGSGGGGGGSAATCTASTVGQTFNDGGSGGYCSGGGAARVKCVAAGVGPSGFDYPHFEPCSCITGTLLPGYSTSGCQ